MSERIDLMNELAREKAGMPPEWHWHSWKSIGPPGDPICCEITGCIAPMFKTGKNAGKRRNYKKIQPGTEKTVYITPAEMKAFEAEWSARTGNCVKCVGTGQEWNGWNHETGTKWRECRECKGSGKALTLEAVAP